MNLAYCVRAILLVVILLGLQACEPPAVGQQPSEQGASSSTAPFHQAPASSANLGFVWPPRVGEKYPDLPLLNDKGQVVRLAQYRGDVLLIMPIAMTSPGSQALAGGDRLGGIMGVTPQGDIASIDQLVSDFSKLTPDDPRLRVVELIIYGPERAQARPEHIAQWAAHFHRSSEQSSQTTDNASLVPKAFLKRVRRLTVVPSIDLRGPSSFSQIPGVQLLDKDGVLRFDATGSTPRHRIREDLLLAIADFAERLSSVEGRYHIEWTSPEKSGDVD